MKKNKTFILILVLAVFAVAIFYALTRKPGKIILTGEVATDEIIVSPEIQGRLEKVLVREGDTVTNGELLANIQPATEQAEMQFYASTEQQATAAVAQAHADVENARLNFERISNLYSNGTESVQTFDAARTTFQAQQANFDSAEKQVQAARAQKQKATVQLGYTEIFSPLDAIVDVRAALSGEIVNAGQAVVTLINPDNLWVRADVPETYIDQIKLGDKLKIKLPSGATRQGTVFYRRVDADYATQRDVSRTKRDIKTFEIRLRCDNSDRALAVGMTAYVELPVKR